MSRVLGVLTGQIETQKTQQDCKQLRRFSHLCSLSAIVVPVEDIEMNGTVSGWFGVVVGSEIEFTSI